MQLWDVCEKANALLDRPASELYQQCTTPGCAVYHQKDPYGIKRHVLDCEHLPFNLVGGKFVHDNGRSMAKVRHDLKNVLIPFANQTSILITPELLSLPPT